MGRGLAGDTLSRTTDQSAMRGTDSPVSWLRAVSTCRLDDRVALRASRKPRCSWERSAASDRRARSRARAHWAATSWRKSRLASPSASALGEAHAHGAERPALGVLERHHDERRGELDSGVSRSGSGRGSPSDDTTTVWPVRMTSEAGSGDDRGMRPNRSSTAGSGSPRRARHDELVARFGQHVQGGAGAPQQLDALVQHGRTISLGRRSRLKPSTGRAMRAVAPNDRVASMSTPVARPLCGGRDHAQDRPAVAASQPHRLLTSAAPAQHRAQPLGDPPAIVGVEHLEPPVIVHGHRADLQRGVIDAGRHAVAPLVPRQHQRQHAVGRRPAGVDAHRWPWPGDR